MFYRAKIICNTEICLEYILLSFQFIITSAQSYSKKKNKYKHTNAFGRYETLFDASTTAVRLAQSSERVKEIEIMFN